jgi:ATP-dependent exoDNAse (exonuclease V) alpha subunit
MIYADRLDDEGQPGRAAHRRRKAHTRRSHGNRWPRAGLLPKLSDHQRDQAAYSLSRPCGLLTGTPGTGKTYTSAAVVGELIRRHGADWLSLCAPTGKAATRLAQRARRRGLGVRPQRDAPPRLAVRDRR